MEPMQPFSAQFSAYLKDESRTIGFADSISFPKSEAEVLTILTYCNQNNIPVTIQGARTGLAAAAVPFGGHVMNLSQMKQMLSLREENGQFFLTVEPGLTLLECNQKLASHQLQSPAFSAASLAVLEQMEGKTFFFAPDPTETTCTIGGMAACNASGARSFLYGPTRNHITALRVVLPSGETLALRRGTCFARHRQLHLTTEQGTSYALALPQYRMPNTKNASGYYIKENLDAIDLFLGSDGTLGVITALELKLTLLPASIWGISFFFSAEETALRFADTVRHQMPGLASVEYFDDAALTLLRKQKETGLAFAALPTIAEADRCCVYLELHSDTDEENMEKMVRLGRVMEQCGGDQSRTWVARNETDLSLLHFFRHAVPESANLIIDERKKEYPEITKLGADMSVPDDRLFDVMRLYRTTLAEAHLESATWGHLGNNHLHVNILPRDLSDFHKGKALYARWAEEISAMGGAVSAEHGVGKIKAPFLALMYGKEAIEEMRQLKLTLDPHSILGNGNLFPSIRKEAEV